MTTTEDNDDRGAQSRTYDTRDNAGPWVHDDGSPCPTYWASSATASDGSAWWCTTHEQHVHVAGTTEDNEARNQGATQAIARELHYDSGDEDLAWMEAERILSALAAEGYTVVKAEWEYGIDWPEGRVVTTEEIARAFERAPIVRRLVGPWEPVPEGSANERGGLNG